MGGLSKPFTAELGAALRVSSLKYDSNWSIKRLEPFELGMERKPMRFCWAMVLVICLVMIDGAGAQFYRYVDPHGNVKFTDDLNTVPVNQRSKVRSYTESLAPPQAETESSVVSDASKTSVQTPGSLEPPTPDAGSTDRDSLEAAKVHIEEMKKKLDADHHALLREQEILSTDKAAHKTREEINAYNHRVEAFNQQAAKYETQSRELRKMADDYNARVIEENSRAWNSSKNRSTP
jgi:hypothetical protein